MRNAALAQVRILRTQPDGVAEGVRILQRAHQHGGVFYRVLGLRETDAAGFGQLGHLGQLMAFQAHGQRAERVNVRLVQAACAMHQHFNQTWLVQHRIGIGRTDQTGDATGQCRLQFGFQRGLVFITGFAQAHRQVDETGSDDQTGSVYGLVGLEASGRLADGGDFAVDDEHVVAGVDLVGRINHAAVDNL